MYNIVLKPVMRAHVGLFQMNEFQAEMNEFQEWMISLHGFKTDYKIYSSCDKGNGVYGLKTCDSHLIPFSLVISKSTILSLCQEVFQEEGIESQSLHKCIHGILKAGKEDEKSIIVAFIIFGLLHLDKDASLLPTNPLFYTPYFRILPTEFKTPVFYKEYQLEWLKGTELEVSIEIKKRHVLMQFKEMKPWLEELHPTKEVTLELYLKAEAIFWSRCLSFKSFDRQITNDDLHLVPFLDFFNHSFDPDVKWTPRPGGILLESLETSTHKEQEEQELFISYGTKPNTELLFIHGFCIQDNPYDSITLILPFIEEILQETSQETSQETWIRIKLEFIKSQNTSLQIHLSNLKNVYEFIHCHPVLYICVLREQDGIPIQELTLKQLQETLSKNQEMISRITSLLITILYYKRSQLIESASCMPQESLIDGENDILNSIGILKMGQLELIEGNILELEKWSIGKQEFV